MSETLFVERESTIPINLIDDIKDSKFSLCAVCAKRKSCTFIKDSKHPIVNCDEFEIDDNFKIDLNHIQKYESSERYNFNIKKEKTDHLGLCVDCARRSECTYEKPESGVWHCDEYC